MAGRRRARVAGAHSMPDHDAYQLRPRACPRAAERARPRPPPLSKYRRKTANARERSRMREINRAFEALRRAVPAAPCPQGQPLPCEKLTKITTLRLAMRYIAELAAALQAPAGAQSPERWPSPPCSELSGTPSEFAEDSLSPFDSFFAEFDCEYVATDRSFA